MTLQPADLDRLEQLAAAIEDDGWYNDDYLLAFIDGDDETVFPEADSALIAALSPATVLELVAAARLGAAWQQAEATLPEGAWLEIEGPHDAPDEGKYTVSAFQWTSVPKASRERSEIVRIAKEIAAPAAALTALAEALRGRGT